MPAEVVVLGDSTGNGIDEWPAQWGATLTDERRVQVRQWDFLLEEFGPSWSNMGGEGPRLRIWNLSQPGANASYPLKRERLSQVTAPDPGVVILNYGHNELPGKVVRAVSDLTSAVVERWPDTQVVITLQNPVTTDASNRQQTRIAELRDWAEEEGLPVIDAWSAFQGDARPLGRYLLDGAHPNVEGTQVWVDAVRDLFS